MATISSSWTENLDVTFDDASPAKTVEGVGPIDLAAAGYIAVFIQFKIIFGGSADGDATIRIRGSADSGTDKDTILLREITVPFGVGETKKVSMLIRDVPYIEVGVYNGNSAVEDITISAKYAGEKYSSV